MQILICDSTSNILLFSKKKVLNQNWVNDHIKYIYLNYTNQSYTFFAAGTAGSTTNMVA